MPANQSKTSNLSQPLTPQAPLFLHPFGKPLELFEQLSQPIMVAFNDALQCTSKPKVQKEGVCWVGKKYFLNNASGAI
ncbi:MAG: hypothetical protein ACJAU0_002623 [Flavobacteriales bacterium]|jgi:hypothetical protein